MTADTIEAAVAPGQPPGEPIAGERIVVDAVIPSAEANKADGKSRLGNTAIQTVLPGAALTVVSYVLIAHVHIDLDPAGAGTDLPMNVTNAVKDILTIAVAYWMNRGKLRGQG